MSPAVVEGGEIREERGLCEFFWEGHRVFFFRTDRQGKVAPPARPPCEPLSPQPTPTPADQLTAVGAVEGGAAELVLRRGRADEGREDGDDSDELHPEVKHERDSGLQSGPWSWSGCEACV